MRGCDIHISVSEISSFLQCRRAWHYSGENRLNMQTASLKPALVLGSGIHVALEAFYRDKPTPRPSDVFKAWVMQQSLDWQREGIVATEKMLAETLDIGVAMLDSYVEAYGETPDADPDFQMLVADATVLEQEFCVPIPGTDDGWLVGRMDGVCRDHTGRAWVVDHKSTSQWPTSFNLNLQFSAYPWAAQQIANSPLAPRLGLVQGERIYGTVYNGLRKQKDGPRVTVSLFKREWIRKTADELDATQRTLALYHREMANPHIAIYPTFDFNCGRCAFAEPCSAAQSGMDEEWLLETNYRRRPSRGELYARGMDGDE